MANKMVKSSLKHYYDEPLSRYDQPIPEPDKTKSISELTQKELRDMLSRLGAERELQQIIKDLKRNSGERNTDENPFQVDTTTPIEQLYHHGIPGQKWGIRRYQNEDGTRTRLGKKRERQIDPKDENVTKSQGSKKSKKTSDLSNEELKALNERLQLESNYKRLTSEGVKTGESWVKKSLADARGQALTEFSKAVMLGSAKLFVKEISPEFAEAAFNVKDKDQKKKS